jgi:hypothetical protein
VYLCICLCESLFLDFSLLSLVSVPLDLFY